MTLTKRTYLLRTPEGVRGIQAWDFSEALSFCKAHCATSLPSGYRARWVREPVYAGSYTETYYESHVADTYEEAHGDDHIGRTGVSLTRLTGIYDTMHSPAPTPLAWMSILACGLRGDEINAFATSIGMPALVGYMRRYVPVYCEGGSDYLLRCRYEPVHPQTEVRISTRLPATTPTFETLLEASEEGDFAYEVVRMPAGHWIATRFLDREAFLNDTDVRAEMTQWYGVFAVGGQDLDIVQSDSVAGAVNAVFDALATGEVTAAFIADLNEPHTDKHRLEIHGYLGEEGIYMEAALPNAVRFISNALAVSAAMLASLVPGQTRCV